MGYYTYYTMEVISGDFDTNHLENLFNKYNVDLSYCDSIKWYDHETEMAEYSKLYPDTVFKLEGDGEDSRDLWVKYFKNGKIIRHYLEVSFPDFNEDDLQNIYEDDLFDI